MFVKPKITNQKSGAASAKSTDIVIIDFGDVVANKWPARDSNGIKMVGNILYNDGAYVQEIYGTSSTLSFPRTSDGDEDSVAFNQSPQFSHPGTPLEIEEFISMRTNRPLGLGVQVSDEEGTYWRIFGTPTNPLKLMIENQDDNEATKDLLKFEQSRKSRELPGRYYGTFTYATANAVAADAVTIDAVTGTGEYQLTDNTAATVITDITNATVNEVYTIKGSGGSNPATIENTNTKFLLTGVDWQGLAGKSLTVVAYEKGVDTDDFVFIEQSRS